MVRATSSAFLLLVHFLPAQSVLAPPCEYGLVAWERDFAAAQARAKETGQPLLVLFQEVPG
jgi:hypothetical protein